MVDDHGIADGLGRPVAEGDRLIEDRGEAVAGAELVAGLAQRYLERALQHPDLLMRHARPRAGLVGHPSAGRKDDLDDLQRRGKAWRRDVAPDVARGGVAPFELVA